VSGFISRIRWVHLLAGAAAAGVVVGLVTLLVAGASMRTRGHPGSAGTSGATTDRLAARTSVSPTPVAWVPFGQLPPAQQACLQEWNLVGFYESTRNAPKGLRGVLNAIQACVDRREGRPPPASLPFPQLLATPSPSQLVATPNDRHPAGSGEIVDQHAYWLPKTYLGGNSWQENAGTPSEVVIYAAAYRAEPSQGLLLVTAAPTANRPSGEFPTPTKAGPVRIVGATGEVLTVRADDGTLFYFDVAAGKYVSGPAGSPTRAGASPAPHP